MNNSSAVNSIERARCVVTVVDGPAVPAASRATPDDPKGAAEQLPALPT
jgi:hypothetical protein